MRNPEDIRAFAVKWRERLLARRDGRAELLSEEEFGQLVTLNTMIDYIGNDWRKPT